MVQSPQGRPCILVICQAELDKWQKGVEDLLAAGVKKKNLPKKPMHWAKRKKPWNEEEEDLEVLDYADGDLRGIAELNADEQEGGTE